MTDSALEDAPVRDYFTDPGVHQDTPEYLKGLRARCPVYREPHHGVAMVTGYEEALEVLAKQGENFSSCVAVTGPIPPLPFEPAGDDVREQIAEHRPELAWSDHFVTRDGADHTSQRTLLTQLLTHTRLKQNEEYLLGISDRLIDSFIDKGGCEITRDYAHALSTLVICDLLGVPEEDRQELVEQIGEPPTQLGELDYKIEANPIGFLLPRFRGYLEERRRNPRGDMMSELALSTFKDGSDPGIETQARLATFLFGAGQDTSARLLAFSFKVLGECPDIQAQLRADTSKIPDFVEEVLRFETPVQSISRLAVRSTEVGGVELPAGTVVTVCTGGANRDPRRFGDPDTFKLDRPGVRDHISFSRGFHACPGAPLARLEARVTLERFLARTRDIRISEAHHGPAGARRYEHEPTYLLHGLKALHIEFDKA